jgi:glycosyltransferase involved in cell wall biosynthesis
MKVLLAAGSSIYIKGHPQASKNNSGFAHMMRDIAMMLVQQGAEVEVISQSVFTPQINVDGWTLLRRKWVDVLTSFKPFYISRAIKVIKASKEPLSFRLRILLYFLTGGYVEKIIKKNKPDILHIHGIGEGSLPYLYACARTKTPCIVTLHGLLSFSDKTRATKLARSMERVFFRFVAKTGFRISVVSSGIKRRVCDWLEKECDNISVIYNPVKQIEDNIKDDKQNSESLSILCVGNITSRKNQIMVLRAYRLLKETHILDATLTFIGGGNGRTELEQYVREHSIVGVKFTGPIDRALVDEYYEKADLLVTASIDEGFGLPMIEAYSHGVPVLAFDDIDAIADVYNPESMVLVYERTDEAFAEGIKEAFEKEWNNYEIKKYADKFAFSKIGKEYYELLNNCTSNVITNENVDVILEETIGNVSLW